MGFWDRFKRGKKSETPSSIEPTVNLDQESLGGSDDPSFPISSPTSSSTGKNFLDQLGGNIKTSLSQIKNKFPKNIGDLRHLKTEETLTKLRRLASGEAYGTYLRLTAAAVAAYFLADTVSLFTDSLTPDPPPVPAPPIVRREEKTEKTLDYQAIVSRHIFNSQGLIPEEGETVATGPAKKTNLPLNLIGTIILKDEFKSIASIEDKSQSLVFPVRIDDTIEDKIRVTKIEHLRVYFVNQSNGQLEYVEIVDDSPVLNTQALRPSAGAPKKGMEGVTQHSDTEYEVDRGSLDKAMSNLPEVLQQARAIPNFENGVPDRYKIIQIVPGSIYDKLGIKNGDVVCGLNGDPINDPGKAFQAFNELKSARNLEICIKRGGKKMTMNYDIR